MSDLATTSIATREDTAQDEIERRDTGPLTFDEASNTIEVVFATGADVGRVDFWTGKRFVERMPLGGMDITELDGGAAVLNAHNSGDLSCVIGSVVPGSVRVQKRKATAKIKLSSDPAHAGIIANIRDGIIRKLSYGYVRKGDPVITEEHGVEVRTWAAHLAKEISFVPVPADGGTGTRAQPVEEGYPMADQTKAEGERLAAEKAEQEKRRAAEISTATAEAEERGRKAEAHRQTEIRAVAAKLGLAEADVTPLMSDTTITLDAARVVLIEKRAAADKASRPDPTFDMGATEREKRHEAMVDALAFRAATRNGRRPKEGPGEAAGDFVHLRLLDIAKLSLRFAGLPERTVDRMPPGQIFEVALGIDKRFHSTSDFPLLLADALRKNLRSLVAGEELNFTPIATQRNVPDFKTNHEIKMGTFSDLQLIPEGGAVQYGTIGEGEETWTVLSYGRGWKVTRVALLNDDLSGFDRIPQEMLKRVNALKLDLFWALFTANANLSDGNALFSAAHANLAAGGDIGAPSAATLGAMREAFRLQTALGGQRLNLMPSRLIIPAAHETAVEQLVTSVQMSGFSPTASTSVVPSRFVGMPAIVEPRLDANSTTRWYAFSDGYPGGSFIYGTLEGQEEPAFASETDFDSRGIKMRIDLDFGVGVTDHRAVYANNGV